MLGAPGAQAGPSAPFYVLDTFGVAIAGTYHLKRAFARMRIFASGDLKKAVVFYAIWASNVRRMASGENNARYDEWSAPPPADLLQPISGLAVAEAMRLPYESVRREIAKLKREGLCKSAPNSGLVIDPIAVSQHPSWEKITEQGLHSLNMLIADLYRLGFDFSRLPRPEAPDEPGIKARGIIRIGGELDMQLFDIFAQVDGTNLVEWFVILTIWDINIGGYYEARRNDPDMAAAPDTARTPVSIRRLAVILEMPLETIRRNVNALLLRGVLTRPDHRGVIVPRKLWQDARHRSAQRRICINIARTMHELARQGAPLEPARPDSVR